jgi:hypothetical protein
LADVYPVHNGPNVQFVPGIPAVPHLDITDDEATALVETGAFTTEKPPPAAAVKKRRGPADAGPSDSKE